MKHICDDCEEVLIFDKLMGTLDKYDNITLICNRYYCPKCYAEYEINEEIEA